MFSLELFVFLFFTITDDIVCFCIFLLPYPLKILAQIYQLFQKLNNITHKRSSKIVAVIYNKKKHF